MRVGLLPGNVAQAPTRQVNHSGWPRKVASIKIIPQSESPVQALDASCNALINWPSDHAKGPLARDAGGDWRCP